MAGPSDDKKAKEPSFANQVQKFDFCGESIDTSLRKLLAKVLLPKEAQQIDRAMEDFAKRYHECNPGLVDHPDVVYAVAFSILLLHTDAHNKNVRQKMNKDTFIRRTKIIEGGEGVPHEILDVMYDNIVMSEFTYADGHKESISRTERSNSWFSKLKSNSNDSSINAQSTALSTDLCQKLEQLMPAENSFSYKRTLKPIPIMEVHFSLLRAKSLCLAGVRSRHADNNATSSNTLTVRVTKAGILDRKYDLTQGGKKANARGWRPFGVILNGSQIIFFADISSFQNWLDEEERQQKRQEKRHQQQGSISSSISDLPPRRNNSVPAFSSLVTAESSSSNLSVNNATVTSISSLCNSNTMTPIPTVSSSSTTNSLLPVNSYLRPVQIVSLSYAICICDEDYTKYPHVFRLITGDGQQFLLRAEDDKDMEDWMLKINYAATLKTTGVRMRPTKRPSTYDVKSLDRSKREEKAREKVQELSDRIDEQVKLLDRELQLRRNLMVLVPFQKSTKDRILSFADTLGKKLRKKRIELQRLECYRDYLECELSWCTSQQQQQQSRKMSLPLPSHLYTFIPDQSASSTLPTRRESIKKLTNLVFTAPSDESLPVSNTVSSSSTTASSHNMLLESSSALSGEEHDETEERIIISKSISSDSRSSLSSHQHNEEEEEEEEEEDTSPTPQLPPFAFPKSFIEGINFMDSKNVKAASNKAVEMDRMMRRRSQSNPVPINRQIVDKKLLLLEPPKQLVGRQRSGSEASSVQGDDDDMSVIIVNDSEELLADSASWQTTTVSNE